MTNKTCEGCERRKQILQYTDDIKEVEEFLDTYYETMPEDDMMGFVEYWEWLYKERHELVLISLKKREEKEKQNQL